jgi:hypothetical protein
MIRRLVISLAIIVPLLLLAALVCYVWPRTTVGDDFRGTVVLHDRALVRKGAGALVACWGAWLLAFSVRALLGEPQGWARIGLVALGLIAFGLLVGTVATWPFAGWFLLIAAALCSASVAVLHGAMTGCRGRLIAPIAMALLMTPLLPIAYLIAHDWIEASRLALPDGRTFIVLQSQVGVVHDNAAGHMLAEEATAGRLFTRAIAIGGRMGGPPGHDPVVIRPAESPGYDADWNEAMSHPFSRLEHGSLVLADGVSLVAFVYPDAYSSDPPPCALYLAWDLQTRTFYGSPWILAMGSHTVYEISPFVLIGADDELNKADVSAALRDRRDRFSDPVVDFDLLERESTHPNPRVRQLVPHLAAARYDGEISSLRGRLGYAEPEERKELGRSLDALEECRQNAVRWMTGMAETDPDTGVRKAAFAALQQLEKPVPPLEVLSAESGPAGGEDRPGGVP